MASERHLDLTVMLASHDAFRRDLARLERAAGRLATDDPVARGRVLAGWEIFKSQLHIHHQGEDRDLWPRMYRGLEHRPGIRQTLHQIEEEHRQIDPLLAAVDTAMDDGESTPGQFGGAVTALAESLQQHLKHEEEDALPYIAESVDQAGWNGFLADQRKNLGLSGAAEFFPWLLDEATPENAQRVAAIMPSPMRLVLNRVWIPRYRARGAWG
jgi:iron-sulfur cluster repair protein YtfE (RIC family)